MHHGAEKVMLRRAGSCRHSADTALPVQPGNSSRNLLLVGCESLLDVGGFSKADDRNAIAARRATERQ